MSGKKGCFLLQRNFAYIGHNLATLLKEKYDLDAFCGYVYGRPGYDFLKKQSDIQYTNLLLDEEIHKEYQNETLDTAYLAWLEKEYGLPNLWPYITVDRVVISSQLVREYPYDRPMYTHEEILRILQVKAKKIIHFLETEKPDYLFFSVVGAMGSKLLFHIGKKKGVRTIVVHPTLIKDTYVLSDEYNDLSEVAGAAKAFGSNPPSAELLAKATNVITSFRNQPKPHWVLGDPRRQPTLKRQQFTFLLPRNLVDRTKTLAKYIHTHFKNDERFDYDYIGPWNYLRDSFIRKSRNLVGLNDLYDEFNPEAKFVFFPLHFEPEISLSLLAPFFTDQIHVIKQLARSLPVGYELYVKEHPAMVVYRPRAYYKEIKKIPNVKLIHPAITSFQITPHAGLLATITGSAGWEATLLQKPVITFGNIFYNQLSFVKNCRTIEELPGLVQEQLENFHYDEKELTNLIAAIFANAANVNMQYLWELETDKDKRKNGLLPLADLLAKKLNTF